MSGRAIGSTPVRWAIVASVCVAGACSHSAPGASGGKGGKGGGDGASGAARVTPVVAANATRRDVPVVLDGLGSVTAFYTATVHTQVAGVLQQVFFTEGQPVKKGQLLAQVDPRPFEIQLHTAEGNLAKDSAALKDDEANLKRFKDLVTQKLATQQNIDDQTALVGGAQGAVMVDKAALESARLNLIYARLVSPIDGVTGIRQVDPGNLVQPSDASGLVIVTQLDPITVYVTLPEDVLTSIANEMANGTLDVDAYSRDGTQKLGTGKLLVIDNEINQSTATLKLKAVFPNPKHTLWPNQFVKARLQLKTIKDALTVPSAAIQRGPDGTFVYVVKSDETVESRPVEVASTQGDVAIIAKGVDADEQVVTDGQAQLKDKAKVKVHVAKDASPSSSPAAANDTTPKPARGSLPADGAKPAVAGASKHGAKLLQQREE